MSTKNNSIGLSDKQRKESIRRSLSGLKINYATTNSGKRAKSVQRFADAFSHAVAKA